MFYGFRALAPGAASASQRHVIRLAAAIVATALLCPLLHAQGGRGMCCGPAASGGGPPVEIKGKVERVRITPGEGMPYVEIRNGSETVKVHLGSMRYLITQGFNPKLGDEIAVKGFRVNSDVVAVTVSLSASNKTIRLRDENGRPLWRGGMRGPR